MKSTANGLVRDIGAGVLDDGPLHIARILEPLSVLWIDRALNCGTNLRFRRRKK